MAVVAETVTAAVTVPSVRTEHAADPAPVDLVDQPGLQILTTPGHAAE